MTNGRPVVAIGAGAFQFKYSLTSVTIPNSVTNIGDYALAYCGLTSVTIPSSVTSIGDGAFRAEYYLTAINVDSLNGYYSSLDGVLFNKSQSVLLQCPAGKTGIYTVPNSVTSIGDAAFEVCGYLTSVTIPNSVRTIGARAFSNCNGLTSMTIPNSVTTIGDQAFSSCFGLASVTIPNSITSIGSYAFDSCKSLTSVTIPNSVTSIGIWAFNGCTGLTNAAVGNSVTSIGHYAFAGCSGLTGVYFSGNAPSVFPTAFNGATNATVYYLAGTTGWGATFAGRPTAVWSPAPMFVAQSTNQTVIAGNTATFSVSVVGTPPFSYQWLLNGTALADGGRISGAMSAALTLTNVQTADAGSYRVVVTNAYGAATSAIAQLTVSVPITLAVALNATNLTWTTGGTAAWIAQTTNTHDGVSAAQSGTITHSQESWLQTIVTGPGQLSFWWRVSSESGYDYLEFYTNGVRAARISGASAWQTTNYTLGTGAQVLRWRYMKDSSDSSGSDKGWVDQVVYAAATSERDFTYATNSGQLTITGYTGPGGNVAIPATAYGMPVVAIGNHALWYKTNLTSVTIPSSVTSIGDSAFKYCSGLTGVTIGNSVTIIADEAFYNCSGLTNVTIGNGVTNIGQLVFTSCPGLVAINVDPLNGYYSSLDGVLFNKAQSLLIQCPARKTGSYTVPNSVTNIGDFAFAYCNALTSVAIPNSVSSIGVAAFAYCSGLTSVPIGNSVTSIGVAAFRYCSGLTSVTIGNSVTSIGRYAFENCSGLASVTIGNSVTIIADEAFAYCSALTNLDLGGVTSIGAKAFSYCGGLVSVTIPAAVTNISGSFAYCSNLLAITVSPANTAFRSVAGVLFSADQSILVQCPGGRGGSYQIPATVSSIGNRSFGGCSRLVNATIPKSVTSIENNAFYLCSGLTNVFFQGNAPTLGGSDVFYAAPATVYYLPGMVGWGATYGGRPAVLWNPAPQATGPNFGVQNNRFGFDITGTAGIPIVVEATTNLTGGSWVPLQTCSITNGSIYFSDPAWSSFPTRFYRVRSP